MVSCAQQSIRFKNFFGGRIPFTIGLGIWIDKKRHTVNFITGELYSDFLYYYSTMRPTNQILSFIWGVVKHALISTLLISHAICLSAPVWGTVNCADVFGDENRAPLAGFTSSNRDKITVASEGSRPTRSFTSAWNRLRRDRLLADQTCIPGRGACGPTVIFDITQAIAEVLGIAPNPHPEEGLKKLFVKINGSLEVSGLMRIEGVLDWIEKTLLAEFNIPNFGVSVQYLNRINDVESRFNIFPGDSLSMRDMQPKEGEIKLIATEHYDSEGVRKFNHIQIVLSVSGDKVIILDPSYPDGIYEAQRRSQAPELTLSYVGSVVPLRVSKKEIDYILPYAVFTIRLPQSQ